MDIVDMASQEIANNHELSLKISHRVVTKLNKTGYCHNCQEEIDKSLLFCDNGSDDDGGCQADFEKRNSGKKDISHKYKLLYTGRLGTK